MAIIDEKENQDHSALHVIWTCAFSALLCVTSEILYY